MYHIQFKPIEDSKYQYLLSIYFKNFWSSFTSMYVVIAPRQSIITETYFQWAKALNVFQVPN